MKTLSKLKLHALKNETGDTLSREKMKALRGGGAGLAYYYCGNGSVITKPYGSCSAYDNPCNGSYTCTYS